MMCGRVPKYSGEFNLPVTQIEQGRHLGDEESGQESRQQPQARREAAWAVESELGSVWWNNTTIAFSRSLITYWSLRPPCFGCGRYLSPHIIFNFLTLR